jgi:HEAT repeats
MGKRRRILGIALVVAALVVVLWRAFGPRGPYYDGKPLSFWLNDHGWGNFSSEAEKAIKQAGTNAIPGLLRMMRARDSSLTAKAKSKANELLIHLKTSDVHFYPSAAENYAGASGFTVIGPVASNVVPQLIKIYEANIASGDTVPAARALSAIGPAATGAVPVLVRGMQSQTGSGRLTAIQALGQIHGQPEIAVPALIKCLSDADALVRDEAAESLGQFGTNALAAVPALRGFAKSPSSPNVLVFGQMAPNPYGPDQAAAAAALEKIDPKAAAELAGE